MGNLATPEAMLARWDEMCRDPSLRDLPYQIELNARGKVEMSPASGQHAWLAEKGSVRFSDQSGERPQSAFAVTLNLPDPAKGYP